MTISGSEVESAMFRPDLAKGNDLRARIDGVRRVMRERTASRVAKVQSSMQANPAKWVGIAAGSGFILGMLGRLLRSRGERHRHIPQLIVIETM